MSSPVVLVFKYSIPPLISSFTKLQVKVASNRHKLIVVACRTVVASTCLTIIAVLRLGLFTPPSSLTERAYCACRLQYITDEYY